MKKLSVIMAGLLSAGTAAGQVVNTGLMDTTAYDYKGKVSVSGYVDTYYGYDFNKPPSGDRPYFVSMARHNEFNINLAYADIKYSSSRLRARFVPGFGTYVNSNHANEPGSLRNIIEADAGIKLFTDKNIWLDVGVFGSPYTNESYISKDHLMYTRSFGAENVPYYLSGLKLTLPVGKKVNAYLYLLNGWQQIKDLNNSKSLGTQLEYRPNNYVLINWDTYVGNEQSAASPQNRTRYFTDLYFIYVKERFSATGCVYIGIQDRIYGTEKSSDSWWHYNLVGKYSINNTVSLSGRIEYFSDPNSVMVTPTTPVNGFSAYSTGLCLNLQIASNVVARFEGRTFYSKQDVFERNSVAVSNSNLLISNLTIWF